MFQRNLPHSPAHLNHVNEYATSKPVSQVRRKEKEEEAYRCPVCGSEVFTVSPRREESKERDEGAPECCQIQQQCCGPYGSSCVGTTGGPSDRPLGAYVSGRDRSYGNQDCSLQAHVPASDQHDVVVGGTSRENPNDRGPVCVGFGKWVRTVRRY